MRGKLSCLLVFLFCLFLVGCSSQSNEIPSDDSNQIANPASVHCIENNGTLEIRENEQGNQYGVCIFSTGAECDEWEYFRKECGQMCGGIAGIICPEGQKCDLQGKIYPNASGICVEKQTQIANNSFTNVSKEQCINDEDCVKIQTTCCPCTTGGKEKCIFKSESEGYKEKLLECSEDIMCSTSYNCKPTKCGCIEERCVEI